MYFRSTWMLGCVISRNWNLSIAVDRTKSAQNSEELRHDCEWKCSSFILRWGHSCALHANVKPVFSSISSPLCHCNTKITDWSFFSAMENKNINVQNGVHDAMKDSHATLFGRDSLDLTEHKFECSFLQQEHSCTLKRHERFPTLDLKFVKSLCEARQGSPCFNGHLNQSSRL